MSRLKPGHFFMEDIQNRKDIEILMDRFYQKLLSDDAINYIFTDVAKINVEKHLPHIVSFWEQILFATGDYKSNVMQIHIDLNAKEKLTQKHFEIWLHYFNQTADENFKGSNTEKIKTRALSIATVMKIKMQ